MSMVLDDFGKLALDKYIATLKEYNSAVSASKAVSSQEEFAEHFVENAPELAEFNDKIERLNQALEAVLAERLIAAQPLIAPAYEKAVSDAGVDLTVLDEQLKILRQSAKYLTTMYGEAVLEGTDKIESRGRSGGGGGGGGRRIRGFDIYVNGKLSATKNAKGEMKSTFSSAAKELGVQTVDLQRAFFEAAGSEDPNDDSFPTVVEFDFGDAAVRAVKVDDSSDE